MVKMQCSIGLSPDVIEFVEEHRGAFSFSAFVEYLIREGIRSLTADGALEGSASVQPRKTIIRIR